MEYEEYPLKGDRKLLGNMANVLIRDGSETPAGVTNIESNPDYNLKKIRIKPKYKKKNKSPEAYANPAGVETDFL